MTEELFLEDAYLREFEARIVKNAGRELTLNRTAFYPGGGGQPPDKGRVGIGPVEAGVVDVKRRDGEIVHVLDSPIPETVENITATLDWDRRFAHMRYHTALHVLSAVIWQNLDAKVTGGKMKANGARMDFSFPGEWTTEVVDEIERLANQALSGNHPVSVYELPREEVSQDPDLIRTRVERVPECGSTVRIVEIEGLDAQADGGTHVANTQEVGTLSLTDHESKGRENKRIGFVLR
ncbi:MAG: alanyl-tRNA editing protein [Rubrobacteraceae bacterium]